MSKRKHTMTTRACRFCGKSFELPAAAAKFDPRRGQFCSIPCARATQKRPLAERFAAFVPASPNENGCLLWMGHTNNAGYGMIGRGGRGESMTLAHRVAWELVNGPIPAGKLLLHECDVRRCVAVEHLRIGTYSDNNRDMMVRDRAKYHLTPDDVREIRKATAAGVSQANLARRYGVWRQTIGDAIYRRTWAHVE